MYLKIGKLARRLSLTNLLSAVNIKLGFLRLQKSSLIESTMFMNSISISRFQNTSRNSYIVSISVI